MRFRIGVLFTLVGSAVGCGGADERPADWNYVHAAIVVPSCATAGCHSETRQAGGVSFGTAPESGLLLLSEQFVTPGDPNSPLMQLLEGRERNRMPPDAPLPDADIELIRRWIVEGAKLP